jgi:hypothetical protein
MEAVSVAHGGDATFQVVTFGTRRRVSVIDYINHAKRKFGLTSVTIASNVIDYILEIVYTA